MAKKEEENEHILAIRKAVEEKKAILGSNRVLRMLKQGAIARIYIVNNAPEFLKEDVEYYTTLMPTEVIYLPMNNKELGVVCKKMYNISMLAFTK